MRYTSGVSLARPTCRFCRKPGTLTADHPLGAPRTRADGTVSLRQTWHHVTCLFEATGLTEIPYPMTGAALEAARQSRKEAA